MTSPLRGFEFTIPWFKTADDQIAAITMEVAAASSRALRPACSSLSPPRPWGRQVSLQELSATWASDRPFLPRLLVTDLAAAYDRIRAAGGRVVAIAPPPSPEFVAGAQADAARMPFTTPIDDGMKVAVAYGVAYSPPAELRPIYLERGYAPPRNACALIGCGS